MNVGEQISLFDLGLCSSKMSQESSVPPTERTSESFLKRRQESPTPKLQFLDFRRENCGLILGAFWETSGLSLGGSQMLNTTERPNAVVESHLSEILEDNPPPKYFLSGRACQGIINRAEKRGKELPKPLKDALIEQISLSKLGGGSETDSQGRSAGKGALIQKELAGTLGATQDQTLFENIPTKVYGMSPFDSNAMKSDNPNSGIYEADTARTLDLNGENPSCNQGGMMVVEPCLLTEDHYGDYIVGENAASLRKSGGTLGGGWRVGGDTVGPLCARDFKGVGDQFFREGKVIIQNVGGEEE